MTPLATGCQNPTDAALTLDDAAAFDDQRKCWWAIQEDRRWGQSEKRAWMKL